MKVYLHIGIEKTGTTTIQDFLIINQDHLKKQGVEISSALGEGNNVLLAAYAMSHDRSSSVHVAKKVTRRAERITFDLKVSSDFLREIKRAPRDLRSLILSNEHCHSTLIKTEELQKLRDLLNQVSDDVTIIVYLRRQIDVCVSLYSTLLKLGLAANFHNYFKNLSLTHFYNYCELVQLWTGVFGDENVNVRLFDNEKLIGNDLLTDFCSAVGIEDTSDLDVPAKTNESLVPEAQNLLLELNRFQKIDSSEVFRDLHTAVTSYLIDTYSGKGNLPSRALAIEKQSIFDESNAKLKSIYFPKATSLFSNTFYEFPE
jgi:hypothetical protein